MLRQTDDLPTIATPDIETHDVGLVPALVSADPTHADTLAAIDTALDSLTADGRSRAADAIRKEYSYELKRNRSGRHSGYADSLPIISRAIAAAVVGPTDAAMEIVDVERQQQRDALDALGNAASGGLAYTLDRLRATAAELAQAHDAACLLLDDEQYPARDRDAVLHAIYSAEAIDVADDSHGYLAATLRELAGRAATVRYAIKTD